MRSHLRTVPSPDRPELELSAVPPPAGATGAEANQLYSASSFFCEHDESCVFGVR